MRDAADNATPRNANTFSLGCLLRTVTLVSLAFGFLSLIATAPPQWLLVGQIALGLALATGIAVRRRGSRLTRLKSAAGFVWMASLVSCYCGFAAFVVQNYLQRQPGEHPWAGLDRLFVSLPLVFGFPFVILLLILMLRAWTWAAHDREIAAGLQSVSVEPGEPTL